METIEGLYLRFRGKRAIFRVAFHFAGDLSILCLESQDRPELCDYKLPRTLSLVPVPRHNKENSFSPWIRAFFRAAVGLSIPRNAKVQPEKSL